MSNVEYQPEQTLQVHLSRPEQGVSWGFRLQGGVDFSTPLSIQTVNGGSVAERAGLVAGDGILQINHKNVEGLSHENAKMEIIRSGNDISMLVQRGAVRIWKPQVTPMSELRPAELKPIQTALGEQIDATQRTSLQTSQREDQRIGAGYNRSARGFEKKAVPNVVHAQFNSPMGLYSADKIAESYSQQTEGIHGELDQLDVNDAPVGTRMTGTYQVLSAEEQANQPLAEVGAGGFRSVNAPVAKPPGERPPPQEHMRCGGCDMLVTGVFVRVKGTPYHANCFKCESCQMNLKQKGYFLIEGKLYCEIHAKRVAQAPGRDMVAQAVYR